MIEINENRIVGLYKGLEEITRGYTYDSSLIYGDNDLLEPCINFIFNQTGEGDVVIPIKDTGLLEYLIKRIKCYHGKYQENGSMLVTPLITEVNGYDIQPISYLTGEKINSLVGNHDFFTTVPTIYYKSTEIREDIFEMMFSARPFDGCHKVFGENILIGTFSGNAVNKGYYANVGSSGPGITFSGARERISNRGKDYYGFTSDEMGVWMFLNIYNGGVNGPVVSTYSNFIGIECVFVNGGDGRMYPPNIEINDTIAKVTHLDGHIEYLKVPYIWNSSFSKLHIGEYLTIVPKEEGKGIYNVGSAWMGNSDGVAIYTSSNLGEWMICADRSDSDAGGVRIKIRPCFKGIIEETEDVEYFKSLPIIN